MFLRGSFAVALLVGLSGSVSNAAGSALPAVAAPAGMRSVDNPGGGRILAGPLGAVSNAHDAFRAGLQRVRGYFGDSLQLSRVVRSTDGSMTMGVFQARIGRVPVAGLAVASFAAGGGSQVDILFDTATRLPHTLQPLVQRMQQIAPPAAAVARPAQAVRTVSRTAQDGTLSVNVPADWKFVRFGEGTLVADGPDEAEVIQGFSANFVDPRGPLYRSGASTGLGIPMEFIADPAQAYAAFFTKLMEMSHKPAPHFSFTRQRSLPTPAVPGASAAELFGTAEQNGKERTFHAFVIVDRIGERGMWSVGINAVSAPSDRFESDLPTLSTIYNSYHLDQNRRMGQVQENIASGWAQSRAGQAMLADTRARNTAVFNSSMQAARASQDSIDRSTSGFVHYLNGTDVVAHSPSGAHFNADSSTAQALVNFDPAHYRSVPVSEYVKGVDY